MTALTRTAVRLLVVVVSLVAVHVALQVGLAGGSGAGAAEVRVHAAFTGGQGLGPASAALDRAPRGGAQLAGLADPAGTVEWVSVSASAARDGGRARATARVEARGLRLLGGRVVVGEVTATVSGDADAATATVGLTSFRASGVTVDGVPAEAVAGGVLTVPGAGEVRFGVTDLGRPGGARANAVEVRAEGGGPALVVGHLDVTLTPGPAAVAPAPAVPAPRPSPDPDAGVSPDPSPDTGATPKDRDPPAAPATPPPVRVPAAPPPAAPAPPVAPGPAPRLLPGTPGITGPAPVGGGAVFPVAHGYSYIDDYGFPRAGTGWHQGNDVFAAVGTPVLAVADGTLSKVGWNTLGGNRLWLTDDRGTAHYYAHLSAYAPAAVDGARVRAGDVIGYVGNTGQASTTPPHLHFEVHPGGTGAPPVNPYPLLRAWERGEPSSLEAGDAVEVAPDAAAGAVVVGVSPERDAPVPPGAGAGASSAR